jgi:response regulator of citrate/malate metabolism
MITALIIESNESDFLRIKSSLFLHSSDIELCNVATLADGLVKIAAHKYDLVLVDIHLPDSNGVETIKKLKAATDVPIKAGAFNYLDKSETNGNLRRAILVAKAKSDLRKEKRVKIMDMINKYLPVKEEQELINNI